MPSPLELSKHLLLTTLGIDSVGDTTHLLKAVRVVKLLDSEKSVADLRHNIEPANLGLG